MRGVGSAESTGPEVKKSRVQYPPGTLEELEFFRVKNDVLTRYWSALLPCVHTHALTDHVGLRTLKIRYSMSELGGLRKNAQMPYAH